MSEYLVECRDLYKSYGHTDVLKGLNLTLESGKIIGLLGPNGSGKTTLIKLLNGLLQPNMGQILIDGEAPGIHSKSVISYLPDRACLPESPACTQGGQRAQPARFRHCMRRE